MKVARNMINLRLNMQIYLVTVECDYNECGYDEICL